MKFDMFLGRRLVKIAIKQKIASVFSKTTTLNIYYVGSQVIILINGCNDQLPNNLWLGIQMYLVPLLRIYLYYRFILKMTTWNECMWNWIRTMEFFKVNIHRSLVQWSIVETRFKYQVKNLQQNEIWKNTSAKNSESKWNCHETFIVRSRSNCRSQH